MCAGGGTSGFAGELAARDDLFLSGRGGQPLHQRHGRRHVLRARDDADARDVRVRPRAVLVGPRRRDGEVGVVLEDPAEVVVVGQADVALALGDHQQQLAVGVDDPRLVRHPRPQQRRGRFAAALGDHVGDQRLVVLVVRRAQAGAAAEPRVAQALVAGHGPGRHALGGVDGHAQPRRQRPPVAGDVAARLRDLRAQRRARDPLQQARLLGAPEVGQVRGDVDVGRGVGALALEPLEQLGPGAPAQLELDARRGLEVPEDLLVAVVRAAVVDHERRRVGDAGGVHLVDRGVDRGRGTRRGGDPGRRRGSGCAATAEHRHRAADQQRDHGDERHAEQPGPAEQAREHRRFSLLRGAEEAPPCRTIG